MAYRAEWKKWQPKDDEFSGYSLLIVDDQKERLDLISECFSGLGAHPVDTSEDAFSAFEKTKNWTPDLAIVDYMLGSMTGFELIEKWIKYSRPIKVMVISGIGRRPAHGLLAGKLGVSEYVTVPFHLRELTFFAKRAILFGDPIVGSSALNSKNGDLQKLHEVVAELLNDASNSREEMHLSKLKKELSKPKPNPGLVRNLLNGIGRVSEAIAVKLGPDLLSKFLN